MTDTDTRVPWSPFAPPAQTPSDQSTKVIGATDPPTGSTSSTPSASAESLPIPKPVEKSDPVVDPEPIQGPPENENSVTERNSALRTPHSENTPENAGPQVTVGGRMQETPHSALNSAPTGDHSESRSGVGESSGDNAATGSDSEPNDEELTLKGASRAWLLSVGDRVQPLARGLRPPTVWTEPPASLKDLVAYASTAPWADRTGPIRMAGRVWCWSVAVPISTVLYYGCWLTQRPSRLFTLLVVYALVAHTSFGSWLPWFWATS